MLDSKHEAITQNMQCDGDTHTNISSMAPRARVEQTNNRPPSFAPYNFAVSRWWLTSIGLVEHKEEMEGKGWGTYPLPQGQWDLTDGDGEDDNVEE